MEGLHSPWGLIGRIKAERGYTHEYVLWEESWINLLMETADQPKYVNKKVPVADDASELKQLLKR